ncbi:HupE/UreJ family protein [Undibacterium sp. Di24W]|uniref:HupE/UreJ family protein n=1 Tax=Undibacterium sp. Di24W TaxID=3413033 RepID=UPI003BF22779
MQRFGSKTVGLLIFLFGVVLMLSFPSFAVAHDGIAQTHSGFAAGFLHPLTGFDHLLMLFAVGFWLRQNISRNPTSLGLVFLCAIQVGAVLAVSGFVTTKVETEIALSLAIAGALLAFAIQLHRIVALALLAVFGIVHGAAHGLELPQDASAYLYQIGLLGSSALILVFGLLLATTVKAHQGVARTLAFILTASACAMFGLGV